MGAVIGLDAGLWRNTGSFGTPTWNEITIARDVTATLDHTEGEVKSRASRIALNIQAFGMISISFDVLHDTAVDDWDVLRDAWWADPPTTIDFLVLDGGTASPSEGFRAECQVKSFSHNQPLEDALTDSVEIKPTPTSNTQPVKYSGA